MSSAFMCPSLPRALVLETRNGPLVDRTRGPFSGAVPRRTFGSHGERVRGLPVAPYSTLPDMATSQRASQRGQWNRQGAPHNTTTVLGKLMKVKNVLSYELGAAIGVDTRTISYWLNGHKPIPADKAWKIAEFFGVTMEFILHDQPTLARNRDRKRVG